ncbi:hypothetical protein BC941DRAFT_436635, partial [Chlamydoabsidia padenii]
MYPGYEDLNTYLTEAKSPTLDAFASNRVNQIAQWTIDLSPDTDQQMFDLWHRRFVKRFANVRPEMQIKQVSTFYSRFL